MNATGIQQSRLNPMIWMRKLLGHSSPATANTDVQTAASPARKVPRLNQTVLVVDDDPVFLRATTARLESGGYDVITATDGSQAIQAARRRKPNLVVLDVNLPIDVTGVQWDGFRIVTWLKRFEELKGIPVVMVTGGDAQKYTREAFGVGARGFFHKRMDPNHLITLVAHTLARNPAALEAPVEAPSQI